jgi:hypothetical protein
MCSNACPLCSACFTFGLIPSTDLLKLLERRVHPTPLTVTANTHDLSPPPRPTALASPPCLIRRRRRLIANPDVIASPATLSAWPASPWTSPRLPIYRHSRRRTTLYATLVMASRLFVLLPPPFSRPASPLASLRSPIYRHSMNVAYTSPGPARFGSTALQLVAASHVVSLPLLSPDFSPPTRALQRNLPIHPFFPHPLLTLMHPLAPFVCSLYWYPRSFALYLSVPIRLPVRQFTDILDDARLYTPPSLWPCVFWPFLPCPLPPFPHVAILTSPRHWLHLSLILQCHASAFEPLAPMEISVHTVRDKNLIFHGVC